MGNFLGGSAYNMVQQIAGGFTLITERNFRRMNPGELAQLGAQIDKVLREIRSEQPALDDLDAIQRRQRKIQRLNSCQLMLRAYRQKFRR